MERPSHLPGLDHLRAIAISIVLLFHYGLFAHPHWIGTIGGFGWVGVDLFFVLSGYLIAAQLFRERAKRGTINLPRFYARRSLRILPAYAAMLALYFGLPAVQEREGISPLWRFATFSMNFGLDLREHGTFSHAWSLCVEEHFYLLLPGILLVLLRVRAGHRAAWILPGLFLLGFLLRFHAWNMLPVEASERGYAWMRLVYYPSYNRMDGLLVGIAVAALASFRPQVKERLDPYAPAFVAAGSIALLLAWWLNHDRTGLLNTVFTFPLVSLAFGCMVLAALSPGFFLHRIRWRPTSMLASLAFSIYLVHKAVFHVVQSRLASDALTADSGAMFACCMATTVIAALALHHGIEKPMIALRDRWMSRSRTRGEGPFKSVVRTGRVHPSPF